MRRSCATVALQKSKAKQLPMKNLHNPGCNFYIPKSKACFWVRDHMHRRQQSIRQEGQEQSYIYLAIIPKLIQNTLQQ